MKKLIKALALLLVLLVPASVFANGNKEAKGSKDTKMSESKDFTVSMLYSDNANYAYDENWFIWDIIKEKTGATFDIKAVPESDFVAKRTLAFNTGELPDIIAKTFANGEQAASGLLLPISDYEDRMPNYKAFIDKYGLRKALDNTRIDGKYYSFPVKTTKQPIQSHQWMIRTDIFKKHNIKIPTTLDEVLAAGKKLKELYPDSVPITNRFQQGNLMSGLGAGFGGIAGWTFGTGMKYKFEKGKDWTFFPTTKNWRDMVTYANKLLTEGVLDPEWNTLDSVVYEQYVTQGKTFILYDWSMNVTRYHNEGRKMDPDYQVNTIMPPKGPYGNYTVGWAPFWSQGWVFSASLADSPNFDKFLKMLDWFYTDEAEILMTFGIEGESFDIVDGVYRLKDPETVDWFAKAGVGNNSLNVRQHSDYLFAVLDDTDRAAFDKMDKAKAIAIPDPAAPLNADEIEESGFKCVGLSDYVTTSMMEFIEGQRPINDATWAEFVAGCEAKGSKWLEETYNKAEARLSR